MFYIIQKRDTKAFCQRKIGFEKFCKKHDIKPMLTGFCAFCGFRIDEFNVGGMVSCRLRASDLSNRYKTLSGW